MPSENHPAELNDRSVREEETIIIVLSQVA